MPAFKPPTPLPCNVETTAMEVIEQYDFSPAQAKEAMNQIITEWRSYSGRFYSYTVAHMICARIEGGIL